MATSRKASNSKPNGNKGSGLGGVPLSPDEMVGAGLVVWPSRPSKMTAILLFSTTQLNLSNTPCVAASAEEVLPNISPILGPKFGKTHPVCEEKSYLYRSVLKAEKGEFPVVSHV